MLSDRQIHISAIQYSASHTKAENLTHLQSLIEQACESSPAGKEHLVVLPEVANFYAFAVECAVSRQQIALNNAEPLSTGITYEWASKIAKQYNIYLNIGSLLEYNGRNPQKPYNTSYTVTPTGEMIGVYRKINLFSMYDLTNSGRDIHESKHRSHGDQLTTFDISGIRFGVAICFDLRFPEIFAAYRAMGCDVVLLPSAFFAETGMAHWEVLVRARAIENQLYIIATNQGQGSSCHGQTMIVSPWGEILQSLTIGDAGYISQSIDHSLLTKCRARISMNRHISIIPEYEMRHNHIDNYQI